MSDTSQKTTTKEEFNRELVRALDDLVTDGRYHAQQIKESLARTEELRRQREFAARERPPSYNGGATAERFDRLDRALESLTHRVADVTREVADLKGEVADVKREVADVKRDVADIRERMATKVELEATNENVKRVADGYGTTQQRLDRVADMLKNRALLP